MSLVDDLRVLEKITSPVNSEIIRLEQKIKQLEASQAGLGLIIEKFEEGVTYMQDRIEVLNEDKARLEIIEKIILGDTKAYNMFFLNILDGEPIREAIDKHRGRK